LYSIFANVELKYLNLSNISSKYRTKIPIGVTIPATDSGSSEFESRPDDKTKLVRVFLKFIQTNAKIFY